jgi:hypothetical protein
VTKWRWIIGIVLLAHGIGHIQGILPFFGLGTDDWNGRSWLLSDLVGQGPAKVIGAMLWLAAVAAFVIAGLGVLDIGPAADSWRGLAAAAAVLSLVTLGLYWNGLASLFSKVGAIGVNLIAVWGAFFADWPNDEFLG